MNIIKSNRRRHEKVFVLKFHGLYRKGILMKKTIAVFLSLIMVLSLAACGQSDDAASVAAENEIVKADVSEDDVEVTVDVEKAGETASSIIEDIKEQLEGELEITIPSYFYESFDSDLSEVEESALEEGFSDCTLNDDGSVTYKMSREKHDSLMQELTDTIEEEISDLLGGNGLVDSFLSIEHDDIMSEFDVFVDSDKYSVWDSFYGLGFYMMGAYYQFFDGVGADDMDVVVNFIDGATNKALDTMSYRDFLKDILGEEEEAERDELPEIEETVLLDHDGIKVTALEYVVDEFWGDQISLLVENSGDKTIAVSCENLIVNDYMCYGLLSTDVEPGGEAYDTVDIPYEDLSKYGISNIGKIEIQMEIYDPNSYETIYTGDMIEIRTSLYDSMDTEAENIGEELYNDNGLVIYGKYGTRDYYSGASVQIYAENHSDTDIDLDCVELSVNGIEISSWYFETVLAGKKSIEHINLYADELEENHIEVIEEIEFVLEASDSESYDTLFKTEPITLHIA